MQQILSEAQVVILPPAETPVPKIFEHVATDNRKYDELLAKMQRFRGLVYLGDGAVRSEDLTPDGRHKTSMDEQAWHILAVNSEGHVTGCLRYVDERRARHFEDLWIHQSALAHCPVWGNRFRRAIELEMLRARQKRIGFGEVGGWAVAECRRWTTDPLRIVLAACGLFRVLGGCAGVATATVRHGSAGILRRIGLSPLAVDGISLPSYYDPIYRCQMEALRFDSDSPNPKYAKAVKDLSEQIEMVPIICREERPPEWRGLLRGLELPVSQPARIPTLQPVG